MSATLKNSNHPFLLLEDLDGEVTDIDDKKQSDKFRRFVCVCVCVENSSYHNFVVQI